MNVNDLLERAKARRRLAALALRRVAARKPMTPDELKKCLEKTTTLQSLFGAPKDEKGNYVGKAGRTVSLMKEWLNTKDQFGLPPVGEAFDLFVKHSMDSANYIWGQEEARIDLARDVEYNFGFSPEEIELVEDKEEEPAVSFQPKIKEPTQEKTEEVENPLAVNMTHMAPMVQPNQGPLNMNASIKGFTTKAQYAYPPSKADDHTVLPETPVITRVDYEEDMKENKTLEKSKKASEFGKDPQWSFNTRNVGKNDLLEDMSANELKRTTPATSLDQQSQLDEYSKPDKLIGIRGFVNKPKIKQFSASSDFKIQQEKAFFDKIAAEKVLNFFADKPLLEILDDERAYYSLRVLELPAEVEGYFRTKNLNILIYLLEYLITRGVIEDPNNQFLKELDRRVTESSEAAAAKAGADYMLEQEKKK